VLVRSSGGTRGFGVLVSAGGDVVTASALVEPPSEEELEVIVEYAPQAGERPVAVVAESEGLALLRPSLPAAPMPPPAALGTPAAGRRAISYSASGKPRRFLRTSIVSVADDRLELEATTSDTLGSPVVDEETGAVVGIVASQKATIVSAAVLARRPFDLDVGSPVVELGTLGGAGNDRVADEDQLGFRYYVKAFADLITSPHTTPPLTIGIFGSWGMGKSFLLEHIEREIHRRQDRS
jgi:hypothetical protein